MKAIRFLQDYRGKLTAEVHFTAGTEDVFDDKIASALIDAGRAEEVVRKRAGSKNKARKAEATK